MKFRYNCKNGHLCGTFKGTHVPDISIIRPLFAFTYPAGGSFFLFCQSTSYANTPQQSPPTQAGLFCPKRAEPPKSCCHATTKESPYNQTNPQTTPTSTKKADNTNNKKIPKNPTFSTKRGIARGFTHRAKPADAASYIPAARRVKPPSAKPQASAGSSPNKRRH